jgi:hypothetical protein
LERAEVGTHKIEVEMDYVMISSRSVEREVEQTLTPNIDCIQLTAKEEGPDIHDASIYRSYDHSVRIPQKLSSSLRAGLERGWYFTDEFPFQLRIVPDLLDCTRSWKSEAPDSQSKLFWKPKETKESLCRILHALG